MKPKVWGDLYMEQKHLDDLDESFVGEEFIDEEDLVKVTEVEEPPAIKSTKPLSSLTESAKKDKKEEKKEEKKLRLKKSFSAKTSSALKNLNSKAPISKSPTRVVSSENKPDKSERRNGKKDLPKESKESQSWEKKNPEKVAEKSKVKKSSPLSPEVTILPKEASEKKTPVTFSAPPVNPWKEENNPAGSTSSWLEEVSTWKTITGLMVVLLVFSVFTQGFDLSGSAFPGSKASLSLEEAKTTTLNYVNTYLLSQPFVAEVTGAEEANDLFKITLSVAGESVDSYLTKDGTLFFPQGFVVTDTSAGNAATGSTVAEVAVDEEVSEEDQAPDDSGDSSNNNLEEGSLDSEDPALTESEDSLASGDSPSLSEPSVNEQELSGSNKISLQLKAKKWIFSPNRLVVSKGAEVELVLVPSEDLQFTFSLPSFAVEQQVTEETKVSFTADKSGEFTFLCSSCEDWRGMVGTLVVE